jgi:hypothetical protein
MFRRARYELGLERVRTQKGLTASRIASEKYSSFFDRNEA